MLYIIKRCSSSSKYLQSSLGCSGLNFRAVGCPQVGITMGGGAAISIEDNWVLGVKDGGGVGAEL